MPTAFRKLLDCSKKTMIGHFVISASVRVTNTSLGIVRDLKRNSKLNRNFKAGKILSYVNEIRRFVWNYIPDQSEIIDPISAVLGFFVKLNFNNRYRHKLYTIYNICYTCVHRSVYRCVWKWKHFLVYLVPDFVASVQKS